jgi:hypothetical protein
MIVNGATGCCSAILTAIDRGGLPDSGLSP